MSNHQKSIKPLTIKAIRAWEFVGNHFSDHNAFTSISTFVEDASQPIAHRAEAVRIMGGKGMGLTDEVMGIEGLTDDGVVTFFLQSI